MNLNANIDWVGKRGLFFSISGLMLALSIGAILTKGFNYAIDFTGGTMVQVTYPQERTLEAVRGDLAKAGYPNATAQSFGGGRSFALYLKGAEENVAVVEQFVGKVVAAAGPGIVVDRKEFVGPSVGRHLKKQATTAILLALLAIIAYVAFRFDNPLWGAAGVASIAHDVTITAGIFAALGVEVDLVIVAAFLTIAGYSINDTIVIFDRMREILRTRRGDLGAVINDSINEMRGRTLITNGLVFAVVVSLFVLGGPVIHNFAFALLIGSIIGTYSTIGLATQLVYTWQGKRGASAPASEPSSFKVKEGRRRK
jgi:preprotein translocase subunit SecF